MVFNKILLFCQVILLFISLAGCCCCGGGSDANTVVNESNSVTPVIANTPEEVSGTTEPNTITDSNSVNPLQETTVADGNSIKDEDFLNLIVTEDRNKIEKLLKKNPELINAKDRLKMSVLHIAAQVGKNDLIELFLNKGLDINIKNISDEPPLVYAIVYGQTETAKLLISKGASVDVGSKHNGYTALHYAMEYERPEIAVMLINKGAKANIKDKSGNTPLHLACSKEMAELLISKGAEINPENEEGKTPLKMAEEKDNKEVMEILKEKGGK